jgi:hypothetical protein
MFRWSSQATMVVDTPKSNEKLNLFLQMEHILLPCLLLNAKVDKILAGIDSHREHDSAFMKMTQTNGKPLAFTT